MKRKLNLDYKSFVHDLTSQAKDIMPSDIDEAGRKYIEDIIFNFCTLATEALDEYPDGLTQEQCKIVCQFIGEWTFHKSIDAIRANIPAECRDIILQKIAFTVFEVAKLGLKQKIRLSILVATVEQQVLSTWCEVIEKLHKDGTISDEIAKSALIQANIDIMAEQKKRTGSFKQTEQNTPQAKLITHGFQKIHNFYLKE